MEGSKEGSIHRQGYHVCLSGLSVALCGSLWCCCAQVVAFTLRPEQIKQLRKEFEKVDVDANGEITIDALSQVQAQSKAEAEEEREVQA